MATAVRRAPLGEISHSRMRGLISQKNTQNAMTERLLHAAKEKSYLKPYTAPTKPTITLAAPSKRSYEPEMFEDDSDFDAENIDPALFSAKRSKSNDGVTKPALPRYILTPTKASGKTTVTRPTPSSASSVASLLKGKVTPPSFDLPGGARTAPAGRSPPQKRSGILATRRINPPSFGVSKTNSVAFSIEEALRGTSALVKQEDNARKSAKEQLKQPKEWFFDIYEDTPDEVSAIVMEHNAGRLDLSGDDEVDCAGSKKDDCGKENIAPADYVPGPRGNTPTADGNITDVKKIIHRSKVAGAMAVDGEERVVLGSLPVADFYGEGIKADDVFHIPADEDVAPVVESLATVVAAAKEKAAAFVIATDADDEAEVEL